MPPPSPADYPPHPPYVDVYYTGSGPIPYAYGMAMAGTAALDAASGAWAAGFRFPFWIYELQAELGHLAEARSSDIWQEYLEELDREEAERELEDMREEVERARETMIDP